MSPSADNGLRKRLPTFRQSHNLNEISGVNRGLQHNTISLPQHIENNNDYEYQKQSYFSSTGGGGQYGISIRQQATILEFSDNDDYPRKSNVSTRYNNNNSFNNNYIDGTNNSKNSIQLGIDDGDEYALANHLQYHKSYYVTFSR